MSPAQGARTGQALRASGPTTAPWLKILATALAWTGAAAAAAALAALAAVGASGPASVAAAWLLIVVFFGISLLVGHTVGRKNPSGAIGMFAVTYAIKVVGFAVILYFVRAPEWLDREWFAYTAIGCVIVWQIAELFTFSRTRHLIFTEETVQSDKPEGAGHV